MDDAWVMVLPKRILVGIDLTPTPPVATAGSLGALQRARLLARAGGASLELVHVAETPTALQARALDDLCRELREEGLTCTSVVTGGPAAEAMARMARQGMADLVVVGRDSHLPRRKLGSTAQGLLERAEGWRVHVVRRPEPGQERVVLAAIDLEAPTEEVLQDARELALVLNAKLHVVHAWQSPFGEGWVDTDAAEAQRRRQAAAVESVEGALARAGVQDAETHVGCDHPARAIRSGVRRLHPLAVVMGTHSRKGLPGLVLGNTAERVLPKLESSLWVVPGQVVPAHAGRRLG